MTLMWCLTESEQGASDRQFAGGLMECGQCLKAVTFSLFASLGYRSAASSAKDTMLNTFHSLHLTWPALRVPKVMVLR